MDINGVSPIVLNILKKRGISEQQDIEEFLSDKPKQTYDPFLLFDMKKGVDFVLSSIEEDEKICIYGDYDVDGITSVALLYTFFSGLSENITYYIPSRFDEGYGLNNESILRLKNDGVDTIITVDCGAVSKNEVEYAKSIGLRILITDHHNMEEDTIPDCIVLNPKHPNSTYPFSSLCGCGVAFKLIQAIVRTIGMDKKELMNYLDLVAIATVSDIVPMVDENRTLVKYGLKKLNNGSRKAMKIMLDRLKIIPGTVDSYKIGFIIGPHMNAAGRMSDASNVVKMLISDDEKEINNVLDSLIDNNNERKTVQEKCYLECIDIIEEKYKDSPFLVVKPHYIHEGISGIVAGKIKDLYYKPTIVLSESRDERGNAILKGSGRSIHKINLIEMLLSNKDLFTKVGGHAMAAGFSLVAENEQKLMDMLNTSVENELEKDPKLFEKTVNIDAVVNESDITLQLVDDLKLLEPYGVNNPKPLLEVDNLTITSIKYMGNENQHVKFKAGGIDCILFGAAKENEDVLHEGKIVNLCGNPNINIWNGYQNLQFIVKTIKNKEESN